MFNDDEVRSALNKMYEYSPADGFVDISQGLGDMIKSLANEPSVGLFYVQQHTHKEVPNLVNLKNTIVAKSRDNSLRTEDSITMVRSMKECGFPIVDDMIKDITKSLAIMSSKQPKKGLASGVQSGSWRLTSWRGINDVEISTNYLSSVFKSAKQKAINLQWASQESTEEATNGSANAMHITGEELPTSSQILIGNQEKHVLVDDLISNLTRSEKFDEFKADKEARFEEWLRGNDTHSDQ